MSTTRRIKWHPPPPPSPRIIHLPRRHRRRPSRSSSGRPITCRDPPEPSVAQKEKLLTLFKQEQRTAFPVILLNSGDCGRRERVREEEEEEEEEREIREEKWKFQAEILRAECNFLRAEREFALKKLEKNQSQLETTLSTAVQTLISGRKKICVGKSASRVLDEEIEDLVKKLRELQRCSGAKDFEVRKCSNFDKQTFLLQKRLEKFRDVSDEKCMKQIQKIAESSPSLTATASNCRPDPPSSHVENLRRKMEGLSKGMLIETMEDELGSMLSTAIISPAAASALTPCRIECSDSSSSSTSQHYQESIGQEESMCQGHCKAVVRRVMEQVRAETEQWSQMQQMLAQVRQEMEDLQAARDFWEEQALLSNHQIQSLRANLKDWRQKAVAFETKANELQSQVSLLKDEIEKLKKDRTAEAKRASREVQLIEKEKRVLICQLKGNPQASGRDNGSKQRKAKDAFIEGRRKVQISSRALAAPKRLPLHDIANVTPPIRNYKKKSNAPTLGLP